MVLKALNMKLYKSLVAQDIINNVRLPSYKFNFETHCSRAGFSPLELWDFDTNTPIDDWKYLGWCPSSSTTIPKSNWGEDYPIAVLLEHEIMGYVTWCHVKAKDEEISAGFRLYGDCI